MPTIGLDALGGRELSSRERALQGKPKIKTSVNLSYTCM